MENAIKIKIKQEGDETVISVGGRLDTNTSPEFEGAIAPVLASAVSHIKLDCGALDYVSSSGLRQLLRIQKNIAQKKGVLRLVGLKPAIREVLDVTGFSMLFRIE